MEFDFARFLGNVVMDLFIGVAIAVVFERLFHKGPRPAWGAALIGAMLLGLAPSPTGLAAGISAAAIFAILLAAGAKIPKLAG